MYAHDELLDNPDLLLDVVTSLKEKRGKHLIAEQQVNINVLVKQKNSKTSTGIQIILIKIFMS